MPAYDRPPRGRLVAQVLGLLVPLSVAGASLFVLVSGSTNQSIRRESMEVSSSAGTVAADSAPISRTVLAAPARPVAPDSSQVSAPPDMTLADTVTTASSTIAARSSATATNPPARRTSAGTRKRAGATTAKSPATARKAHRSHAETVRVAAAPGLSGDSNNLLATRTDGVARLGIRRNPSMIRSRCRRQVRRYRRR